MANHIGINKVIFAGHGKILNSNNMYKHAYNACDIADYYISGLAFWNWALCDAHMDKPRYMTTEHRRTT